MIGFCDIEKKGENFEIKTRSNSKNTFEIKRIKKVISNSCSKYEMKRFRKNNFIKIFCIKLCIRWEIFAIIGIAEKHKISISL